VTACSADRVVFATYSASPAPPTSVRQRSPVAKVCCGFAPQHHAKATRSAAHPSSATSRVAGTARATSPSATNEGASRAVRCRMSRYRSLSSGTPRLPPSVAIATHVSAETPPFMGRRHVVAAHVHPPWGHPIAQTAGTGRRSSTSTLSTENLPSRSRSASSFPRSRARSGAEWRASQKR
jgi:hypothetical protein